MTDWSREGQVEWITSELEEDGQAILTIPLPSTELNVVFIMNCLVDWMATEGWVITVECDGDSETETSFLIDGVKPDV